MKWRHWDNCTLRKMMSKGSKKISRKLCVKVLVCLVSWTSCPSPVIFGSMYKIDCYNQISLMVVKEVLIITYMEASFMVLPWVSFSLASECLLGSFNSYHLSLRVLVRWFWQFQIRFWRFKRWYILGCIIMFFTTDVWHFQCQKT